MHSAKAMFVHTIQGVEILMIASKVGQVVQCLCAVVTMFLASNSLAATIAGGGNHSIAMRADGVVFSWGANSNGSLGNGSNNGAYAPQLANNFSGAKAVAAGASHTIILKTDSTVWAWGYNGSGQLGKGDTSSSTAPVQVQYLQDVAAVAAGDSHSLALDKNGMVWAWGDNGYGQLGLSNGSKSAPLKISSLSNVKAIAAGSRSSYALKTDGTVWAWGYNSNGELGNGSTSASTTPVQVAGAIGISAIAAGTNHAMALKQDGTVLTWGYNSYCQLGNGVDRYNYCQSSAAATAVANLTGVAAIAASQYNSMVLKSDGTTWVWGSNQSGQLGNNSQTGYGKVSVVPVQVSGLSSISEIASSTGTHFLARKATGEVYAWGNNSYGQLGNNEGGYDSSYNTLIAAAPIQVVGPGGDGKLNLVSAGTTTTELCKGSAALTSGLFVDIPCVSYNSTDYTLRLMLDPSLTSGTYFKMISISPR